LVLAVELTLVRIYFDLLASDYTFYPFATTNPVDYKNLRNVYMDAAFFPHLRELDFKQEGWRLEHENPNGTLTDFVIIGEGILQMDLL